MDDLYGTREGLTPSLGTTARLLAAIVTLGLLLQLVVMIVTLLRAIFQALVTTLKISVLLPARILFHAICVPVTFVKLVVLLLAWSTCSLARGIVALFMLFGLLRGLGRHGQLEAGGGVGGGDGKLSGVGRQEASRRSVQGRSVAGRGAHGQKVHVLLPDRSDRHGHNAGILVGGMGGGAGAWQATTLGRGRLVVQGGLARHSITEKYTRMQGGRRS